MLTIVSLSVENANISQSFLSMILIWFFSREIYYIFMSTCIYLAKN